MEKNFAFTARVDDDVEDVSACLSLTEERLNTLSGSLKKLMEKEANGVDGYECNSIALFQRFLIEEPLTDADLTGLMYLGFTARVNAEALARRMDPLAQLFAKLG